MKSISTTELDHVTGGKTHHGPTRGTDVLYRDCGGKMHDYKHLDVPVGAEIAPLLQKKSGRKC
jgi:hypothetical protein